MSAALCHPLVPVKWMTQFSNSLCSLHRTCHDVNFSAKVTASTAEGKKKPLIEINDSLIKEILDISKVIYFKFSNMLIYILYT